MTAPVIRTTACIWCASPLLLYKSCPYTRYCKRPKNCYSVSSAIRLNVASWKRKKEVKRKRVKAKLLTVLQQALEVENRKDKWESK